MVKGMLGGGQREGLILKEEEDDDDGGAMVEKICYLYILGWLVEKGQANRRFGMARRGYASRMCLCCCSF